MKPPTSLALVLFVVACRPSSGDVANGPDPLQALAQHVESSRYGPDYWKRAAAENTAVWRKATAFCRQADASEYPTCASVKMAEFFQANTQPASPPAPFTFRNDRTPDTTDARPQR